MIKNNNFLTSLSKDLIREVRDLMAGKKSIETPLEDLGEAAKTLTDKQKKLDKNNNGKLDADDFRRLRAEGIDRVIIHSPYVPDIHGGLAEVTHRDIRTGVVTVMFENMYYKLKKGQFKELPEEVEELDELSKSTLQSYIKKGARDSDDLIDKINPRTLQAKRNSGYSDDDLNRKLNNRDVGYSRAVKRLAKEEVEELDEGASEEVELDELSRQTTSSYFTKAYNSRSAANRTGNTQLAAKRNAGMRTALDKMNPSGKSKIAASGTIRNEDVELTQEELDRLDAMVAEMEEIDEGRGRPPKEGSEAWKRRQTQAAEDIPALGIQLRKAASINKPVTFANGESKQIHPNHINRFNDHMDARKTSQEKSDFQKIANKSHADFVKAVSADIPQRKKDTGEIVKYGK